MSYFTHEQDQHLRTILSALTEQESPFTSMIEEHDLLGALSKSSYKESVKEDIEFVADNDGVDLNEEELDRVASLMCSYDHSDYNEFISDMIQRIIQNRN